MDKTSIKLTTLNLTASISAPFKSLMWYFHTSISKYLKTGHTRALLLVKSTTYPFSVTRGICLYLYLSLLITHVRNICIRCSSGTCAKVGSVFWISPQKPGYNPIFSSLEKRHWKCTYLFLKLLQWNSVQKNSQQNVTENNSLRPNTLLLDRGISTNLFDTRVHSLPVPQALHSLWAQAAGHSAPCWISSQDKSNPVSILYSLSRAVQSQ